MDMITIELEEDNGSFEERVLSFEQLVRNHRTKDRIHFLVSKQIHEFKKALASMNSSAAENGFLAVQAYVQELEWFQQAWKAFDDKLISIACRYLDLCAQSSNANAMLILAHIYGSDKFGQKDIEKSIQMYNQAASLAEPLAMRALGILYYEGLEIRRDEETALNYFLQASKKNDAESMFYLGEMYLVGCVVKQDSGRARQYFEQSARGGCQKAILKLQAPQNQRQEQVRVPEQSAPASSPGVQAGQFRMSDMDHPSTNQSRSKQAEFEMPELEAHSSQGRAINRSSSSSMKTRYPSGNHRASKSQVEFKPINYGLRSSQDDYYHNTARHVMNRQRSRDQRRSKQNSTNKLIQIVFFAAAAAILAWLFYSSKYMPKAFIRSITESMGSNIEINEDHMKQDPELDAPTTNEK